LASSYEFLASSYELHYTINLQIFKLPHLQIVQINKEC